MNALLTYDSEFEGQTEKLDLMTETFGEVSVLFWKPVYLFKAKVQRNVNFRYKRKDDGADLKTLYDIIEKRGEKVGWRKAFRDGFTCSDDKLIKWGDGGRMVLDLL